MYRYFVDGPFLHQNKTLTANKPRPDVDAAVPGAGPNTGFQGIVASGDFSHVRLSCAYVVNVGPGVGPIHRMRQRSRRSGRQPVLMRRSGARTLVVLAAAIACAVVGLTGTPAGARPTAAAVPHAPIGAFDTATARFGNAALSQPNQQTITFSGWAADQDLPGSAVEVHLYLDGQPFQPVGTGRPRPDVDAAVPWARAVDGVVGHDARSRASTPARPSAPTRSTSRRADRPRCSAATTSPGPTRTTPVGSLDTVTVAPGLVRLRGWAGDPDGYRTTRLRVYYDHSAEPAADAVADLPRPDVRRAFPRLSPTTGFDLTLPIAPGARTVCVLAQNTGPAGFHNADLGCRDASRSPTPARRGRTIRAARSDRVRNTDGVSWRAHRVGVRPRQRGAGPGAGPVAGHATSPPSSRSPAPTAAVSPCCRPVSRDRDVAGACSPPPARTPGSTGRSSARRRCPARPSSARTR